MERTKSPLHFFAFSINCVTQMYVTIDVIYIANLTGTQTTDIRTTETVGLDKVLEDLLLCKLIV